MNGLYCVERPVGLKEELSGNPQALKAWINGRLTNRPFAIPRNAEHL